ncbi:MAG: hypothetical protein MJ025_03195 [Victivallaceae bacterium]|nr:hypothetical protein [Victivallaceae bacterium]
MKQRENCNPLSWIPSLYFAEGIPAAVICEVSVILFAALGWPVERIAAAVSLLGMPWMLKPLWSPAVDIFGSRKSWVVAMQLSLGILFGATALAIPCGANAVFACLATCAFLSATHDVAADGYYLAALSEHDQSLYSGWRSVFFRIAMVAANGGLLMAVAMKYGKSELVPWQAAFGACGAVFVLGATWHSITMHRENKIKVRDESSIKDALKSLMHTEGIVTLIVFLLLYRFAEAQLGIVSKLFLIDPNGGGMSIRTYGRFVGVYGIIAMLAGGLLGGAFSAKFGLRRSILPMAIALNLPDVIYTIWAFVPIETPAMQAVLVALEQFGYGFGFTGYMLVMLYMASRCGRFSSTAFAFLSCLMIAGLRLPGLFSGALLQKMIELAVSSQTGYRWFFTWVLAATLVSYAVAIAAIRHIPEGYGTAAKDTHR